ncbi:MAG: zinc ribbon domain-containing protein [Oscillospiraceae bacterium]|nr:zinc ribbon domain-containing protein [Oscillospiraceae bacterium]
MFCQKCGNQLPDNVENFCPNCGGTIVQKSAELKTSSKRIRLEFIIPIVLGIIVILIILFDSVKSAAISDLKSIVFDQYGSSLTLGDAADLHLDKVNWESEKISDDEYKVTLQAFSAEIGTVFSVEFRVTYMNDMVYALPVAVNLVGEEYKDDQSIWQVMSIIYGRSLEEANETYWEAYLE